MKGIFKQKSLEYTLDIRGESWTQGSVVMGSLRVKSADSPDLSSTGVFLAHVHAKKFKARDSKAFTILQESMCTEESSRFQFSLPRDCPITESAGSLFILCGQKDHLLEGGHLELNVTPHKAITDFMQVLEFQYRFKFKPLKNKKDFIETSITLPDANKYTSVQQLKLHMKMQDTTLCLKFFFKLKKMDLSSGIMSTVDKNLEILKDLTPEDYQIYGDSVNQDGICKHMDEIIGQIEVKSFV